MDWGLILSWAFLATLLASGIRLAVPVLLAALGEIFTEQAGVLNLGVEGIMSVGAFGGFAVAFALGNPWLGILAGTCAGALMGLLMAYVSVTFKVNQVIAGLSLVILGQGLSAFLYRQFFGVSSTPPRVEGFATIEIPGLSQVPVLGKILFQHDIMVYLTGIIVVISWFVLFRTTWGLTVRAVGEHPAAADASGIDVTRVRYICTILGSAMAGLGGSFLSVGEMNLFLENMIAGRGWVAIALVIFARWKPELAVLGALLFGVADALQLRFQALGFLAVPYEFLLMLPYVLTILALLSGSGRSAAPAALGIPYVKEQA